MYISILSNKGNSHLTSELLQQQKRVSRVNLSLGSVERESCKYEIEEIKRKKVKSYRKN